MIRMLLALAVVLLLAACVPRLSPVLDAPVIPGSTFSSAPLGPFETYDER